MICAVVFDVGETLIDERASWGRWAEWLGVPRERFMHALAGVVQGGEHHRRVFEIFRPGLDVAAAAEARRAAGDDPGFRSEDFYPDALPCLRELKSIGLSVGIAGNTSPATERFLVESRAPADFVASSGTWGVEKPSPAFFARIAVAAGMPKRNIAYAATASITTLCRRCGQAWWACSCAGGCGPMCKSVGPRLRMPISRSTRSRSYQPH